MKNINRTCIFTKNYYPIIVEILAEPGLIVRGDFKIYDSDAQNVLEHWQKEIIGGINKKYQINHHSDNLNKTYLVWQMAVCTNDYSIPDGKIQLTMRQLDVSLKITPIAEWFLTDLVPAHTHTYKKFTDGLIFIGKDPNEKPLI